MEGVLKDRQFLTLAEEGMECNRLLKKVKSTEFRYWLGHNFNPNGDGFIFNLLKNYFGGCPPSFFFLSELNCMTAAKNELLLKTLKIKFKKK